MKRFLLTMLLLFTAFCFTGCNDYTFDETKGVLRVGLECSYAPFNWTETTKTDSNVKINNSSMYAEGYDVQIAKIIAKELGYELQIQMIEWNGLVIALNSGKIDLIIAGMSPTEERKQVINFTDAYYTSNHVLLMKKDSNYINAKKFSDLNDAKVMGQINTVYDKLAMQVCDNNKTCKYLEPLDNVPAIVYAINSNVCDITILEEPVAKGIISSDPNYTYIKLDDKFILEDADKIVSIGIRKQDTILLEKVNTVLNGISEDVRLKLMEDAVNAGEIK